MTCLGLLNRYTKLQKFRVGSRARRGLRPWRLEVLEERVLLSTPTVYTVTNTSGSASTTGSLPSSVNLANANPSSGGSVIQFDPTVFATRQTITLPSKLVLSETSGPETIEGPGASQLTISGGHAFGVVELASNDTGLSGLTISGGSAVGNGGGIDNEGTLTLTDCTIAGNSAGGGSIYAGGGIYNNGPLTIIDSTITGNSASGGAYGGGIANEDNMTMTDSTVSDNSVSGGGSGGGIDNENTLYATGCTIANNNVSGVGAGAGIFNQLNLTVLDSTIAGNSAVDVGGGVYNDGTILVDVINSTIANNAAAAGGGIYNTGTLTVVNATIAGNTAAALGDGGGLYINGGPTTLDNTIVDLNTDSGGTSRDDIYLNGGASVGGEFNLIGAAGNSGWTNGTDGNQVGVTNPGLGALANNGGPTSTIALLPGSPAIDAGSSALAVNPSSGQPLTTDQRSAGFVRIFNGSVDIGAYEVQPAVVVAVSVDWGMDSAPVYTAADGLRLLPAGRNNDLPWLGIDELQITLNQPATLTASDVTIQGVRGINYGPVTITGSGTSYTLTFARPIEKADRVTITIAGAGIATYTRRLDVLPGDFNDNGVVKNNDAAAIRNEWKHKGGAQATIFGDILGLGMVGSADYNAARKRVGTKLPKLGGNVPQVALARTLARRHPVVKHKG